MQLLLDSRIDIKVYQSQVGLWSSHRRCFIKKHVLKSFSKFTRQHLCLFFLCHLCHLCHLSLFFNKVTTLIMDTEHLPETASLSSTCSSSFHIIHVTMNICTKNFLKEVILHGKANQYFWQFCFKLCKYDLRN